MALEQKASDARRFQMTFGGDAMHIAMMKSIKHTARLVTFSALVLEATTALAADKDRLLAKGKAALEAMEHRKAIRAFERARTASGGESFEASFGLARAYLASAQLPAAREAVLAALESTEALVLRAHAFNVLGTIYYLHDVQREVDAISRLPTGGRPLAPSLDLAESERAFREALRLRNGNMNKVRYNLAETLTRAGRNDEALQLLNEYFLNSSPEERQDSGALNLQCWLENAPAKIENRADGEFAPPEKISGSIYTALSRKYRDEDTMYLRAIIDEEGAIRCMRLLKKGLLMVSTEPMERALSRWKFRPATLRGKPVSAYFSWFINFCPIP